MLLVPLKLKLTPPVEASLLESRDGGILKLMPVQKVRVEDGRIKLDEATELPNGTELYLVPAEGFDEVVLLRDDGLDAREREELLQVIDESLAEAEAGQVEDFSKLIAGIRQQS